MRFNFGEAFRAAAQAESLHQNEFRSLKRTLLNARGHSDGA
jgi:hypothetical protein